MDILVVGAGFFGCVVAEQMASAGHKVLLIEKRPHIGGNCWSEIDRETGIECHKYGSHIFHTSNEDVWSYLSRFTSFNQYRHTVWTTFRHHVYSMPINLATINSYYSLNLKPFEVEYFLEKERAKEKIKHPSNLEEKAISLIGRPLYEAFIRGYTIKQWEQDPKELPPEIIDRLPVRYNFDNRYFNDKYEGIPLNGYGKLFESLIDHRNIELKLNTDYFNVRSEFNNLLTLYTGPIDRFFDFKYGHLDWRTIQFERNVYQTPDFQGCSVMNYADPETPFTRIHEFKHYHPERKKTEMTITFKEFSHIAGPVDDPYYPVNTPRNNKLLAQYQQHAQKLKHVVFGGRLGLYCYLDMDDTVAAALQLSKKIIGNHF